MTPEIKNVGPIRLIGYEEWVSCKDGENFRRIPQIWAEFFAAGKLKNLLPLAQGEPQGLIGVCTDMDMTNQRLRYLIAVASDAPLGPGMAEVNIPAAQWGVFEAVGKIPDGIQAAWKFIYGQWLPQSTAYNHAMLPELEIYPQGDTAREDYRCFAWIPVVAK